ncbi:unnamed protein product [Anisakis simplex]|uniref:Mitochondrial import receptor subunit TOM20 homolog (inferred by orthology to a C. elegans protein) n=1 Tax=Anisakis simplex TaxID=6269 RepID=A0A0M3JXX5_ANISI|nr:unnamed protein product [Anisakis simplex]
MSEQQSSLILGLFSRQQVITAASVAAAAFVGYCLYFDHKRRSAPDYKQKIRENRRAAANARSSGAAGGGRQLPNMSNPTEVQAFFLQEVQLGEEMIAEGATWKVTVVAERLSRMFGSSRGDPDASAEPEGMAAHSGGLGGLIDNDDLE